MHESFLFFLKTPAFTNFIERFGYIGILIWFLTFDQVTPLPEEISLLIVGYLCANHIFNPVLAGACCLAAFIAVDSAYFYLSKKGSAFIKKRRKNPSHLAESYREKLKNHTGKTIMILCFIPRMRMWAPILAGSMRLPFKKFLFFEGIALAIFTALYLSLGVIFHKSLSGVLEKTKNLQHIIFFGALIVIAVVIIILIRRHKKNGRT